MISPIEGLPEGVLGFDIGDKITTADYEDILGPAIWAQAEAGNGVRAVVRLSQCPSMSAGAMWDDIKLATAYCGQWRRIAMLADASWIKASIRVTNFMMPGQFRAFDLDQFDEAVEWAACEDGGLHVTLSETLPRIATLEPGGRLTKEDFADAAAAIDPVIEEEGDLAGILIATKSIPGWTSFGSFLAHLRFAKDHHQHVKRIAVCSDSSAAQHLPSLGKHFVSAEVKSFDFDDREDAMEWLRSGD